MTRTTQQTGPPEFKTGYSREKWARDVVRDLDVTASAAHLLLILATFADEHGVCWPSMDREIRPAMRLSARRVRQLSADLVAAGVLEVEHDRRDAGGRRLVNRYRLVPTSNRGKQATGGNQRPAVADGREPGEAGSRLPGEAGGPRTDKGNNNPSASQKNSQARASALGELEEESNGHGPPPPASSVPPEAGTQTAPNRNPFRLPNSQNAQGKSATGGRELPLALEDLYIAPHIGRPVWADDEYVVEMANEFRHRPVSELRETFGSSLAALEFLGFTVGDKFELLETPSWYDGNRRAA